MAEMWTQEREGTLVRHWVDSPCLYDVSSRGYYMNRGERQQALNAISLATSVSGLFRYSHIYVFKFTTSLSFLVLSVKVKFVHIFELAKLVRSMVKSLRIHKNSRTSIAAICYNVYHKEQGVHCTHDVYYFQIHAYIYYEEYYYTTTTSTRYLIMPPDLFHYC